MPTTANFSLEYPDDNSSVDIAGHFETLADDVDAAINTRLALTGGTLTGSLSGTSLSLSSTLSVTGTTTLTGDLTISKASPTFRMNATSGDSLIHIEGAAGQFRGIRFRTGTSSRWSMYANSDPESGSDAGSNFQMYRVLDGGSSSVVVSIARNTGAVTLAGALNVGGNTALTGTLSGTSATFSGNISTTAGTISAVNNASAKVKIGRLNAANAPTTIATGAYLELGSGEWNTNSYRLISFGWRGSGTYMPAYIGYQEKDVNNCTKGDLIFGTRDVVTDTEPTERMRIAASGDTTLTGDLTISKASPTLKVSASSGNSVVSIEGAAGTWRDLYFKTGSLPRWSIDTNTTAESGSNAGSDFGIYAYSDAGASLSTPLTITRSTGAVTLTGTLNGKVVNDLVTGPASATDNALVRFDNTTGKVVQNSGITVDDSGNITSDLTVSKAAARARFHSASGDSYVDASGVAGTWRGFRITTGTSVRWSVYASGEGEAGSGSGSNLVLYKGTDGGSELYNLVISRSTGKWSFRDVGATAGLELGASGPRDMAGTGSPEGVVTAPVGSTWRDTNATTGAIKWIKATGTGNTGWVVEYGDTGWRNIESLLTANATDTVALVGVRRVREVVSFYVQIANSVTATPIDMFASGVIPSGFRPRWDTQMMGLRQGGAASGDSSLSVSPAGQAWYRVADGSYRYFIGSYVTSDAWPSSLPGSAA